MSQFELENALREATRMDSSLNTSKAGGHKPRKALDNSTLNVSTAGALIKLLFPITYYIFKLLRYAQFDTFPSM